MALSYSELVRGKHNLARNSFANISMCQCNVIIQFWSPRGIDDQSESIWATE